MQTQDTQRDSSRLLRGALRSNAAFSTMTGAAMIVASQPIAEFIGITQRWIPIVVGVSLLGFAFGLIRNAARDHIDRVEVGVAVAMDLAWVLGSVVLIAIGLLSNSGNVLLFAVGDVVLLFAILQWVGLRRLA